MVNAHPLTQETSLQRDLLYIVHAIGPASGEEIANTVKENRSEQNLDPQVNQALHDLINKGCIEKRPIDAQANKYRLTNEGWNRVLSDLKWRFQMAEQGRDQ